MTPQLSHRTSAGVANTISGRCPGLTSGVGTGYASIAADGRDVEHYQVIELWLQILQFLPQLV